MGWPAKQGRRRDPGRWGLRYRAFISYSHADARHATWLHRRLEAYRLPSRLRGATGTHGPLPERLSPIFRDRDDLPSAGQLGPQIQAALENSEALVVVCSPNAAQSTYVDAEILTFKRLGRGDRIYAFIVDGEPNSGDANECFPPALRYELDADGNLDSTPANPVAADARPGKDGKPLALLKLLAGLFGLPLDTLRQREARRRHLRMTAITALAVVVMLVTSVLAVQAMVAKKAAERRQKQAETLVDFMLGDLNDKLSEVGRLDILSSVNDKAMAYFQSLPKTDVTDEALEQRAKALVKIGIVRSEQGALPKAMESFKAAAALSGPLARARPADLARQLAYADILSYIGVTHWYQGDMKGAQQGFDATHNVLAAARRHAPGNPRLLYQLTNVDNNNGHVLEATGHFEEAAENYERMLAAAEPLAVLDPDNLDWQGQLGLAHNNLAKMALMSGNLAKAINGYRADLVIQQHSLDRDRRNNAQHERLLISRATLGRTLALGGQLDEGAALLRQTLDDAERLNVMEPGSTNYQFDIGLYAYQLAKIERQRGQAEVAKQLVGQSLEMLEAMIKASPEQTAWQREHAAALTESAEQIIASGKHSDLVNNQLTSALETLEPQLKENQQDRGIVLATANAWLRLASVSPESRRKALAERALATIDVQTSARQDPRLLALKADALTQLGRKHEAKPITTALSAAGYHDFKPPPSTPAYPAATTSPKR
ncbi:toll/interleukin-1 receptor domain-containing protein [Thermomonas sp. HDW16]|uniref:toll/interleukin-1 receptor domain-containing protein n=1 Tax=Thermomonas sp. HDW16 TaxID=2714945 RepID=UPI00140D05E1|nr:toll/interleukin-1 receptor domain-containing protein [Thermomonas sp. HDW16]QIL19977.1 toll/interleukin-1 receptor domain-containing protein [Thermomonas sp. HDW16]